MQVWRTTQRGTADAQGRDGTDRRSHARLPRLGDFAPASDGQKPPEPAVKPARALKGNALKLVLMSGDGLAIALGYTLVIMAVGYPHVGGWWRPVAVVCAAVAIGLFAMRSQGLFLARVSAVRVVELTRSTRAAGLLLCGMVVFDRVTRLGFRIRYMLAAAVLEWVFTVIGRSAFRSWMSMRRSNGHHQRPVLVVGADAEAARLVELFATHTDLGISVVGIVGSRDDALEHQLGALWLGEADDAEKIVAAHHASGVVVCPTALSASRLNHLIRRLQRDDIHVHLATGVSGIDARRMRSLPLSHEPLLYVEAPTLSRTQVAIKRVFDVVVSSLILIIASPLMAAIAIAVKLQDRGPVLFRQQRVGRAGATFNLLKFRTMGVDAEAQLARLKATNERSGPLFKMERDPRVTRVGRLLRESSLDELPQLVNVLRGQMSLVGPRPALPSEVATFGAELRQRERVRPGITGLWQVEARDCPSFEAYRRLDLFYVENWSITFDLLIVLATAEHLITRLFAATRPSPVAPSAVVEPDARAMRNAS